MSSDHGPESIEAQSHSDGPDPIDESDAPDRALDVVQIIALVKPFRAQAVLNSLASVPLLGGTVREVMGYGRQKSRLHQYLGSEYDASFLPKVELKLFVERDHAESAVRAIVGQAQTGRIGDGKILVTPCVDDPPGW